MSGITPGWGGSWETLANAITSYFGGGIGGDAYRKVVQMLNSGEYTMQEMESILNQIPEIERTYNSAGELVQVAYKEQVATQTAAQTVAQEINSNAAAVATKSQFKTVQTIVKDPVTQKVTISDSVTKYKAGSPTVTKTVASSAVAAVAAAATAITLDKIILSAAYNVNPDWFNEHGMSSINPETWASITAGDNSLGAKLFNFIFQIDPDTGNPQAYIDETTFAYMAAYMASLGFFDAPYSVTSVPEGFPIAVASYLPFYGSGGSWYYRDRNTNEIVDWWGSEPTAQHVQTVTFAENDGVFPQRTNLWSIAVSGVPTQYSYTFDDRTVYYLDQSVSTWDWEPLSEYNLISQELYRDVDDYSGPIAWLLKYGSVDHRIDGIENGAGQSPDFSSLSDYSDIAAMLALLKTQFPGLWDERIEVSPDGEKTIVYVPVSFPTGGSGTQPTTDGASQDEPAPDIDGDGENATDELIKTIIDMIQNPKDNTGVEPDTDSPPKPVDPNPVDTGTGDTPPLVIPVGSASALYSIYNPTQAQLNDFGGWLWSSSFVDQLLKLFNDPMQAIIGLHKVFAPPPISGTGTIKVGYLDSGVSSKLVGGQYVDIPCGSVTLKEFFNNVFDYDPHTQVNIYLPFIGIQRLDTGDVMRGEISVVYHVDVITGACLAEVKVNRDMSGGTLYTYSGNCAVQYPISSGSYMGIVASAASIAGGIVGTIATGGALAPVAMGAVSGVLNAHTRVQHSGSFSGNAGAMGIKKPYLIITRPQTAVARNVALFDGYPANESVNLIECSGFVRCHEVHIENINATESELSEIETLLKSGVLI